LAVFVEQDP